VGKIVRYCKSAELHIRPLVRERMYVGFQDCVEGNTAACARLVKINFFAVQRNN
jgi:hypothetical protein